MCTQGKLGVLRKDNNNNLFNPALFCVHSESFATLPRLDAFILNIFIGMLSLMNCLVLTDHQRIPESTDTMHVWDTLLSRP